jgi:hypothetical protein
MARRRHWLERRADGRIALLLLAGEVQTMLDLMAELRELLDAADSSDPAYERLFPNAYLDPTEEDAEAAYGALSHSHLLTSRLEQLATLSGLLASSMPAGARDPDDEVEIVLDESGEALLLGELNDVRLALGSALGVTEDPADEPSRRDPTAQAFALYQALTALQGDLVELLLDALPEA